MPNAAISNDRFHVVAMANEAMDEVRRAEMREDAPAMRAALKGQSGHPLKGTMWGMRENPAGWNAKQLDSMHWLQRSTLRSARAWRLKMALGEAYALARGHNDPERARIELQACLSWARRSRLEPFKKLATTIKARFDAVVRSTTDHRSNAVVEAMYGQLQQAKRAARGYRSRKNFIAIAYLRLSRLKSMPDHPSAATAAS